MVKINDILNVIHTDYSYFFDDVIDDMNQKIIRYDIICDKIENFHNEDYFNENYVINDVQIVFVDVLHDDEIYDLLNHISEMFDHKNHHIIVLNEDDINGYLKDYFLMV